MEDKRYRVEKFTVGGMSCANCADRIEKAVSSLPGVKKISVSYGNGAAVVVFDIHGMASQQGLVLQFPDKARLCQGIGTMRCKARRISTEKAASELLLKPLKPLTLS